MGFLGLLAISHLLWGKRSTLMWGTEAKGSHTTMASGKAKSSCFCFSFLESFHLTLNNTCQWVCPEHPFQTGTHTAAVSGFSLLPWLLNTNSKSPLHWLESPQSFFFRNIEPARLSRLFGVAWWGWEGVGRREEGWEGKRQFMEPVGSWLPPTGTF